MQPRSGLQEKTGQAWLLLLLPTSSSLPGPALQIGCGLGPPRQGKRGVQQCGTVSFLSLHSEF